MALLTINNVLPLLDLCDAGDKADLAKFVLSTTTDNSGAERTNDPVKIGVILYLSEILADSINALSIRGTSLLVITEPE